MRDWQELSKEEQQIHLLKEILAELKTINATLESDEQQPEVTDFVLNQIIKGEAMAINGTVPGATSEFQIGLVPATGAVPLQSGPTVTVDDTLVTLGAVITDAAGNTLTFTAATVATDTAPSYNVTVSGVNGAGAPITHTFNVPFLPVPVTQVTDFSLNQLS